MYEYFFVITQTPRSPTVNLTRWQNSDSVQKLVNSCQKMFSFFGLVSDVMEDLVGHDGGDGPPDLVVALDVDFVLALIDNRETKSDQFFRSEKSKQNRVNFCKCIFN